VSVPWVITIPSAWPAVDSTVEAIRTQSAGVSCELSSDIRSMTSTSSPAVSSAPLRAGRRVPSAPAAVAIVPPVLITTRRCMPAIMAAAGGGPG